LPYDVKDKRVLITGGSSGIGAALAVGFAEAGAVVGICARRRDRLAEVLAACRAHQPDSKMWVHDLSDPDAVDQLAAQAQAELGPIDVLVNNAGIPKRRHVTKLDPETVNALMRINYESPIRLTLALLPQMLARDAGRIVNISSIAATISSPNEAAYDATKAALTAFSEAMAVDLWDTGVKVLIVYPGVIDTELFTLPDNDPLPAGIDAVPVSELVTDVMAALRDERLQVYVPAWFGDLTTRKAADVEAFLAGSAAFVREQSAAQS
jgi:short-subunit dehydrogenase